MGVSLGTEAPDSGEGSLSHPPPLPPAPLGARAEEEAGGYSSRPELALPALLRAGDSRDRRERVTCAVCAQEDVAFPACVGRQGWRRE